MENSTISSNGIGEYRQKMGPSTRKRGDYHRKAPSNTRSKRDEKKSKDPKHPDNYKAYIFDVQPQTEFLDWHKSKQEVMKDYYEAVGKTPTEDLKEPDVDKLVNGLKKFMKDEKIRVFLNDEKESIIKKSKELRHKKDEAVMKKIYAKGRRNHWLSDCKHTGSVYEGLKANDGLEYDVMFLMKGDQFKTEMVKGQPGYFTLIQKPESRKRSLLNKMLVKRKRRKTATSQDNKMKEDSSSAEPQNEISGDAGDGDDCNDDEYVLSPQLVINKFQSIVQRFLKQYTKKEEEYKIRRHGPAIQVDFSKSGKLWYSVDLVPSYDLKPAGGRDSLRTLYVPKPPKSIKATEEEKESLQYAWRASFSLYEKEKLTGLDRDNGCRRQVVRFLKGFSKCDVALNDITSYYWKTALFHVTDREEPDEWKAENFSQKVFQLLWFMAKFVEQKNLPVYFMPNMNLFRDMSDKQSGNIANRLYALFKHEARFDRVLLSVPKEENKEETEIDKEEATIDNLKRLIQELYGGKVKIC